MKLCLQHALRSLTGPCDPSPVTTGQEVKLLTTLESCHPRAGGGWGTRLAEEAVIHPKILVGVDGRPILWHIFKIHNSCGMNDFIVCCGCKGYMIKEYFANHFLPTSDVTFHMDVGNHMEVHQRTTEPWKVTLAAVPPPGRFGGLHLDGDCLGNVRQKADGQQVWINGGFLRALPAPFTPAPAQRELQARSQAGANSADCSA